MMTNIRTTYARLGKYLRGYLHERARLRDSPWLMALLQALLTTCPPPSPTLTTFGKHVAGKFASWYDFIQTLPENAEGGLYEPLRAFVRATIFWNSRLPWIVRVCTLKIYEINYLIYEMDCVCIFCITYMHFLSVMQFTHCAYMC